MAIALLLLNACFLAFAMYLLGQVATNSGERNKSQTELISKLVSECHKVP
jgi:hypothetical protein